MDPDDVSDDTPVGNDFTQDTPRNGIPMDSPPLNGFPMDPLTGACSSFYSLRRSMDPDGFSMTLFQGMTSPKTFLQPILQQIEKEAAELFPPGNMYSSDGILGGESLVHSLMDFRPLHQMERLNYGSLSGGDLIRM
jgi:hypothetical protein